VYTRQQSRTWQAYSSGDHLSGDGRRAASPVSSAGQAAALRRSMAGTSWGVNVVASNPHSRHGRRTTQVQSFVSGAIMPNSIPHPAKTREPPTCCRGLPVVSAH